MKELFCSNTMLHTTLASNLATLRIQGDRLNQRIEDLAQIGSLTEQGVCRRAFSPEDQQARALVAEWMTELEMHVTTDPAGNVIGTYPGLDPAAPALATGSHIDTVPTGGKYDGSLGVLAGLELVQTFKDHRLQLRHPFQVIVFTDEENTMIGSKAMAGRVQTDPLLYTGFEGQSIQACLKAIGGDWDRIQLARKTRQDMIAFVELHVEQGRVLEHYNRQIGIVEGVVSLNRMMVKITGSPNHAGTTPMSLRQDALVAAAQIVTQVHTLACETPGDQVATVGSLTVWPNAVNVVPGYVELTLDFRDLSQAKIQLFRDRFHQAFAEIARRTDTEIHADTVLAVDPTLATPHIQDTIRTVTEHLDLTYYTMPSRAGHDAQEMGKWTDMGMIFVPSTGGISHSAEEYTSPEQCTQGANVLLHTFLHLDDQYPI